MNSIARVILVAVLAFGSGCAKPDWIQQTLVTVDVTGVWAGSYGTGQTGQEVLLDLEQQGTKVTGYFRRVGAGWGATSCSMGLLTAPWVAMCSASE